MINFSGKIKWFWLLVFALIITVIASISMSMCTKQKKIRSQQQIEYRTDIQPLIDRFGDDIVIDSCFWKADTFYKGGIGPTSYWMKGFMLVSKNYLEKIGSKYSLSKVDLKFNDEINPNITGFNQFEWNYNKELSENIMGTGFVGKCYLDTINGVIYFDLESN